MINNRPHDHPFRLKMIRARIELGGTLNTELSDDQLLDLFHADMYIDIIRPLVYNDIKSGMSYRDASTKYGKPKGSLQFIMLKARRRKDI